MAKTVTIYHNPRCSTSRKVLGMIQESGVEPTIVKYLDTPPSHDGLRKLLDDAGLRPGQAIRRREALYAELGLADADDDALIDAMVANPILIERPIVVTDKGTRIARPAESVAEIL
ncbi:arsenate reductase (glutaredoxin) [Antrihabitans sp. YC2-6]|uniref:arsenate reductase (glutaredoxin) n=1 Tax=Antrihabitans sp. YC2-6 TaxID=2799498 RepID=UPI0035A8F1FA